MRGAEEEEPAEPAVSGAAGFVRSLRAAWCAAMRMWSALLLTGRGRVLASSGKLSLASRPLKCNAATSYAAAAISGVSKLPSQILVLVPGSRISDTHFPHFLLRTPRYAEEAAPTTWLELEEGMSMQFNLVNYTIIVKFQSLCQCCKL